MGSPYNRPWDFAVRDHGGQVWNIQNKAFGANVNGTDADDTALENILSECAAGDVILFPPDASYVIDQVVLTKPVTLWLYGATIKKAATTVGHMFPVTDGETVDGLRVFGGKFNMNRAAFSAGDTVSPFFIVRGRYLTFVDMEAYDGIEEGLKLYGCQHVRVIRPVMRNFRNNGIQFHNPTVDSFTGTRAKADSYDLLVRDGYFEDIDDALHGSADGHAVTLNSTDTTYTTRDALVQGCTIVRAIRGLWAEFGGAAGRQPGYNIAFKDNHILDSEFFGAGMIGVQDGEISGNRIEDTGEAVVGTYSPSSSEIVGVVVGGDSFAEGKRIHVHHNQIVDRRGGSALMEYGIWIKRGDGHVVKDNSIEGATNTNAIAGTSYNGIQGTWASITNSEIVPSPSKPICKTDDAGSQTIATATWADVEWDAEEYDTASMHDNTTNPELITFRFPGRYRVSAGVCWPDNATGYRRAQIVDNAAAVIAESVVGAVTGEETCHSLIGEAEFDAGDYVKLAVYQTSGGDLTLNLAQPRNYLAAEYLGPKTS